MKICIHKDFIKTNFNITATIYLEIDGQYFPDNEWTDFPVIILSWWNEAIANNYYKKSSKFDLLFMDGPYYIECVKHESVICMNCIERRANNRTIYVTKIGIREFSDELIRVSRKVMEYVSQKGLCDHKSVESLKNKMQLLDDIIINEKNK